jgi:hypothetical protein
MTAGKEPAMNELAKFKPIAPQEFVALGMEQVAYIKPIVLNDQAAFAIHAADGTQMAVMNNRLVAEAAVRQYELEPVSVH